MSDAIPVLSRQFAVQRTAWAADVRKTEIPATGTGSAPSLERMPASGNGTEFEAMFLRQVLEIIMPDDSKGMFGGGTGSAMWRSLLIENVAETMAVASPLGIAAHVEKSPAEMLKVNDP